MFVSTKYDIKSKVYRVYSWMVFELNMKFLQINLTNIRNNVYSEKDLDQECQLGGPAAEYSDFTQNMGKYGIIIHNCPLCRSSEGRLDSLNGSVFTYTLFHMFVIFIQY